MSNNQVFRNFGDVTRRLAATQPDRVALTFEGRDTTYGEFERYTNRVAAALLASGVKKGERVAYFGKNSDRHLEIFFGAAKVGAVTTPINWRLAGPELAYILQDSRAPILFVGEEFGDIVEQVAGDCPCLKTIVDMDTRGNRPVFKEWRDAQAETAPASDVGRDDDVLQLYTSGTTGRPKGAMLMARNLLDLQDMVHRIDGEWDDISLIAMPIGHIGGTGWAFWTLFHGAKGIVVRDFDPTVSSISSSIIKSISFSSSRPRFRSWSASRGRVASITATSNTSPMAPVRSRWLSCGNVWKCSAAVSFRCTG
jgi:long-chain acyl-CoA synthetase